MTEGTPQVSPADRERVVRLHPDAPAVQRDFFRRTGFHPIVHIIVLRREAVDRRPTVLDELCEGFDRAKQSAYALLQNERTTGLPLMRSYLDETLELFGDDPWPYGLDGRNGAELDRFLEDAHKQGLTEKRLSVEELFDAPARQFRFRSRMGYGANLGALSSVLGHVPASF